MISFCLKHLCDVLNEEFKNILKTKNDLVKLQQLTNNAAEGVISLSLLNIENDNSRGSNTNSYLKENNSYRMQNRSLYVNACVLFSVVYPEGRYLDSLKVFDILLSILNSTRVIEFLKYRYIIEIDSIDNTSLSNYWSIANNYYPSVYCKIKTFEIKGEINSQELTMISETLVNLKKNKK